MKRMVTRTVERAIVGVRVYNLIDEQAGVVHLNVEPQKNDGAYLKLAKKQVESDEIKVLKVEFVEIESKKYGMTEELFISMAEVM